MADTFLIPNEGELEALKEYLANGEDWVLKLFKSNTIPSEADTAANYTVITSSDFPSYADLTLTRAIGAGKWSNPASGAPTATWSTEPVVAESVYGSAPFNFVNDGSGTVLIQGYILVGVNSGKLRGVQRFESLKVLGPGDSLTLTPRHGAS